MKGLVKVFAVVSAAVCSSLFASGAFGTATQSRPRQGKTASAVRSSKGTPGTGAAPTRLAGEGCGPKWSPSGNLVCFYVGDYWRGSDVRIVDREGNVLHHVSEACYPAWLSSDDKICYTQRAETGSDLCLYELQERQSSRVYHSEDMILFPYVSPDGQSIAFLLELRGKKNCEVGVLRLKDGEVKTFWARTQTSSWRPRSGLQTGHLLPSLGTGAQ